MPTDKQGGQGTQRSGEKNNQETNDNIPQQGQQRQQDQNQQEPQKDRMPGGEKGNR